MKDPTRTAALEAYEAFAPFYDEFNHRYQYRDWTSKLLERAAAHGLHGDRLLDVACGTGLSFTVPLERGFWITGCDISPAMIDRARERAAGRADLLVADVRTLPVLGDFDLIWAVNDALNYLLDIDELIAALAAMRGNLAPGGILLWDLNTLATFRDVWVRDHQTEHGGRRFTWRGARGEVLPGATFEAWIGWEGGPSHRHRQRHFGAEEVRAAISAARLTCLEVSGEHKGELERPLDEERHTTAVYVCRARRRGRSRGRSSRADPVP